jgi:hypothetical protein
VFSLRIKHARNQTGLEVVSSQFDFPNRLAAKTLCDLVQLVFYFSAKSGWLTNHARFRAMFSVFEVGSV